MNQFDPFITASELEDDLGGIGLHAVRTQILSPAAETENDPDRHGAQPQSHVIVMECLVGDVAFTSRVQDAVQRSIDEEFAMLTRDATADQFEQIRRDLMEGK